MPRHSRKVAIITGGARGIGAAIAYRLGSEGARVAIFDIDGEAGLYRVNELRSSGIDAIFVRGDVSREGDVVRCVDEVLKIYGGVDILVNNAGIGSSGRHLFDQTLDEWERVIAVNLTGPYLFSKHASRIMASRGGGVIINIASTRALQSEPNTEAYSASKGGLLALTHALAMSLSRYRIRVVSISPGWVDTSRWAYPPREPRLSRLDHMQHPAGRVGAPEDVAALVSFLASEEAGWITGVNIVIDGGMTTKMIYLDEDIISNSAEILTGVQGLADALKKILSDPSKAAETLRILRSSGII